jgi:hypothetical protein
VLIGAADRGGLTDEVCQNGAGAARVSSHRRTGDVVAAGEASLSCVSPATVGAIRAL